MTRHKLDLPPFLLTEELTMAGDDLLLQAVSGDRTALDELCRREWRSVYGLIYRAVQNQAEAQDLTQEVFLRALRSLDRYQVTTSPFSSYLNTIARNLLRDRWRKRSFPCTTIDNLPEIPGKDPGPEQLILSGIDEQAIRSALASLTDDHQMVLRLRILDGRSSKETGQLMGRSPAAIRQLQRRALIALRAILTEEALI